MTYKQRIQVNLLKIFEVHLQLSNMKKSNWNSNTIPDQSGKTIIITGATSGLGKEATKILSQKNARVIMAVRNTEKGATVKKEILHEDPNASIDVKKLDLSSLSSIKQFAYTISKEYGTLDILINNAGVMMCPYSTTEDEFEIQMGTNHLGPFALTGQLLPLLKKTPHSRIVNTSSIGHRKGNIDFSDVNWKDRKYKTINAYCDSKLANLYFTYELAEKLKEGTPSVIAAHPGWTKTDLQRHSSIFRFLNPFFSQTVKDGVLPTLRAATDPDAISGEFYGPSRFREMHGSPIKVRSNDLSHNKEAAKKLWAASEKLTKITY